MCLLDVQDVSVAIYVACHVVINKLTPNPTRLACDYSDRMSLSF